MTPYSPDNQWLALMRIRAELPDLVEPADRPSVEAALPSLAARLEPANDKSARLAAALDLQDLIAPHPAARSRFLAELHIQAGLQAMLDVRLAEVVTALSVDAAALEPSLALALRAVSAQLAEPVQAADQPRLVKIGVGGRDGGQVVRLRNLTIDFKALITLFAGIVLTRADVIGAPDPLTVVSGLFLIVTGLIDGMTIEVNTDEASVFWGFIQVCGRDQLAAEAEIIDETNLWRASYKLPPLTPGEIATALHKLVTLGVLVVSKGGWQLVDRYEIR
jgi:hypothetical protein